MNVRKHDDHVQVALQRLKRAGAGYDRQHSSSSAQSHLSSKESDLISRQDIKKIVKVFSCQMLL